MQTQTTTHVHLLSATHPPSGGLAVWTNSFLDHAPQFGIAPLFESIGPLKVGDANRLLPRMARFGRGFLAPLHNALRGKAKGANVVHICVSGGLSFWRGLVLAALLRGAKRPCVVHLHARTERCSRRSLVWAARLAIWRGIQLVTPNLQDATLYPFFRHVPNFVPPHVPHGSWGGVDAGAGLRLVFAGAMTPEKGIGELLQAMRLAPESTTLDCYGPDILPKYLLAWRKQVQALGLSSRVRYRGCLSPAEVPQTLSRYDALVLPSRTESFSLVAAECMRMGLPVLGTPVGLLLDAPRAAWVPLGVSPHDMAQALAHTARHKSELLPRVSAEAMAYIEDALSAERTMSAWRALYAQVACR